MDVDQTVLAREYRIFPDRLTGMIPGWAAQAYRVQAGDKLFFLKAFDKSRPSSRAWMEAIDRYMPAVVWLSENTNLGGRMSRPLLTRDGQYKCEDDAYVYVLFEYIDGVAPRDTPLTRAQRRALAQIMADLHCIALEDFPLPTEGIVETFDVPFHDSLLLKLQEGGYASTYNDLITDRLHELRELSREVSTLGLPFVLCHTDVHGWNLIQSGRLVLIDWEGLKFSPAEADLFSFAHERYLCQHWDEFWAIYGKARPGCRVNETAMRFFRLRRRLEDIDDFLNRLFYDNLSGREREDALQSLIRECELLD